MCPACTFFATFLHEDIDLDPSVRFYQRMLATDQDGATEVIDELLKEKPRAEVFDQVVIPSLSLAERDHSRDEIDELELAFVHQTTDSVLEDLADEPEINLSTLSSDANAPAATPGVPVEPTGVPLRIMALPAHDETDALVLRMLDLLMKPTGVTMTLGDLSASPLEAVERISAEDPDLVLISHLPPDGLTATRYLTRRIRARFPKLPIAVCRWDHDSVGENVKKSLTAAGATRIFNSLVDARAFLTNQSKSEADSTRQVAEHAQV